MILILLLTLCYNFQVLYNVCIIFKTRNFELETSSIYSQIFYLMITESLKKSCTFKVVNRVKRIFFYKQK